MLCACVPCFLPALAGWYRRDGEPPSAGFRRQVLCQPTQAFLTQEDVAGTPAVYTDSDRLTIVRHFVWFRRALRGPARQPSATAAVMSSLRVRSVSGTCQPASVQRDRHGLPVLSITVT